MKCRNRCFTRFCSLECHLEFDTAKLVYVSGGFLAIIPPPPSAILSGRRMRVHMRRSTGRLQGPNRSLCQKSGLNYQWATPPLKCGGVPPAGGGAESTHLKDTRIHPNRHIHILGPTGKRHQNTVRVSRIATADSGNLRRSWGGAEQE